MSHTEADPPPSSNQGANLQDRVDGLEAEQKRQGSILERIEQALAGGKTSAASSTPPDGKPIAELVREGVEQLRAEEQAQADRNAEKAQREDHAARLAALEERPPSETAATPAGRFRATAQRWVFGEDRPRR